MSPITRRSLANIKPAITSPEPSTRRSTRSARGARGTRRGARGTPARSSSRRNTTSGLTNSTTTPSSSSSYSEIAGDNSFEVVTPLNLDENNLEDISVIDLASPSPRPLRRARTQQPLEVDLTCDLDEEVFVVLEDIANPYRRNHNLPIALGASPPRARPTGRTSHLPQQNTRSTSIITQPTSQICTSSAEPQGHDSSRGIQCPICLESLAQIKASNQQMYSTTCGHLFCGTCIRQALANINQCPSCRQPQKLRSIHPIFI